MNKNRPWTTNSTYTAKISSERQLFRTRKEDCDSGCRNNLTISCRLSPGNYNISTKHISLDEYHWFLQILIIYRINNINIWTASFSCWHEPWGCCPIQYLTAWPADSCQKSIEGVRQEVDQNRWYQSTPQQDALTLEFRLIWAGGCAKADKSVLNADIDSWAGSMQEYCYLWTV